MAAAAAGDVGDLQDEVERILRRLTLDETKVIAVHMQIEDVDGVDSQRDVLRMIQGAFDGAADDDARSALLRGLPVPEAQRPSYERLFEPQQMDGDGGVPQQNVGDQVVPATNGLGLQQGNVVNNGGALDTGDDLQQNNLQQNPYQNLGGLHPLYGLRNPGGLPQMRQNVHAVNAVGMRNAGFANALNPGGVNAGGYDLGVVAQNRLLYGQNVVNGGAAAGAVNARLDGLVQNPRNAAIQAVLNAGNQAQNAGGARPRDLPHVQNGNGGVPAAQNMLNAGPRPRNFPQNAGIRPPAPNVPGGQNAWNGGQPPNNLAGVPMFDPNMQAQFLQYPQQRFVQMFPREFRMTGTICDDISKSMTYLDICRQVSDGRLKGYSDHEILSGMRRIMTTGAVKTYVDSLVGRPLEEVLLFLRSFLKTETRSELNNRLSQLVQQEGQLAIKFFMEAIEIRQLIVVGSQVEGTHSYDPNLVHSTFLHTIRTGLRDESVRSHMLPFLSESSNVDDNTLIRELHKAVAEAEERRKKTEKPVEKKTNVKVNAVESSPELVTLIKVVQDNQNQMKVLQEQMGELLKSNPAVKKFKKPGCEACAAANKADSCRHCWKCGDDGHKASETDKCPKSN